MEKITVWKNGRESAVAPHRLAKALKGGWTTAEPVTTAESAEVLYPRGLLDSDLTV